jgi:type I polyketide synthase AVES
MQASPTGGAMVALEATEDEVVPLLAGLEDQVGIAAVNGPRATVISGAADAVSGIAAVLARDGRRTKRLRVTRAFHSPLMDGVLAGFDEVAQELSYRPPRIRLLSNLTGELATEEQVCSPGYWVRHVREAVRFHDGARRMAADGITTFLELGPGGVLSALVRDSLAEQGSTTAALPLLRHGRPEAESTMTAVAHAHVRGVTVSWEAVFADTGGHRIELPTYVFQRRRYWPESSAPIGSAGRARPAEASGPATTQPVADDGPARLRERLDRLGEAERDAILRELVAQQAAAALGHASTGEIESSVGLAELGIDSLTAAELAGGLQAATGLAVASTVVFEHPTLDALAAHLRTELDVSQRTTNATASTHGRTQDGLLGSLARHAVELDQFEEFNDLLAAASRFRETFSSPFELTDRPVPVRLAHGPSQPRFFCFPSFAGRSGAHQYARLASAVLGRHDLWALPAPGFVAGERLPDDLDALVRLHAEDVERCAETEPFAIVGHSAGGWIAHAVTTQLEKLGIFPLLLVLLDSYRPGSDMLPRIQAEIGRKLTAAAPASSSAGDQWDDTCLTAMGGYARLFETWQPRRLVTPTFQVRAAEPLPGFPAAGWQASWPVSHTEIEVPGDHFTMTGEHSCSTMQAVQDCLAGLS